MPRDSGANCTEIDRAESGETLLGDDGEFYPICSICPANAEVVNAVTLLAYPDVTCPFGYRDVRDANECERLAIQNGASLVTVIASPSTAYTLLYPLPPRSRRIRMGWAAVQRRKLVPP